VKFNFHLERAYIPRSIRTVASIGLIAYIRGDKDGIKGAALKMGISARHLRLLLETGEVKGKKLGHGWVVLSLDYKRRRKPKTKKGGSNGQS